MYGSIADTVRALQLLKELLIHAEETEDESVLLPLEEASDALRSNLFNELIDIHNNLNKVYNLTLKLSVCLLIINITWINFIVNETCCVYIASHFLKINFQSG